VNFIPEFGVEDVASNRSQNLASSLSNLSSSLDHRFEEFTLIIIEATFSLTLISAFQ
jgi:hypothetical protein